jgi:nucleoside 2-deoxyribosyltransferase
MKAFVIMPFNEKYDDIYQIGIKETAKASDIKAYRLDEELFDEGMLDKIYKEINNCDFIIADLSDKNPNVFYELGYAHAIEKLCILITKEASNIPFDLKHKRHIVYGDSIVHLQEQLKKNIEWAKKEIDNSKNNPFEVKLKIDGSLSTSDEYAEAKVNMKFDIENKTNRISPEIHAIYLHSNNDWTIKQDEKKVTYRKSELNEYNYKYSLSIESNKIPRKGWKEIEITSTKILAQSWKGDEIKDSYTINGNVYLEIVTDKGSFSKKLPLLLIIDNLPF